MIVVSVFFCIFYCSDLGIPYYGTQHIYNRANFFSCWHLNDLARYSKNFGIVLL